MEACYEKRVRSLVLSLMLVSACGRVCAREETLSGLDGGVVACVLPTDCPRPANVLVCGNLEDHLRDCIDCKATQCVRYLPEVCK